MDNAQQFELFQDLEKVKSNKSLRPEGAPGPDFRRYKRAIFLVIYSIIILIIGFAFGVEHAKKRALSVSVDSLKQVTKKSGKFSIKLASFKNAQTAQRELAILKKKGYAAYLVAGKGVSKLYSGPFKTKEEAERLLRNLKARYPDCFITK